MHFDQIGHDIPEGTTWSRVSFTDPPSHYEGLGGTKKISNTLLDMSNTTTPFEGLFVNLPTPAGSVMNLSGCVYGCTDPRSQFSLISFPTNGGSYFEQVHQDTGFIESIDQKTTTGALSDLQRSPNGWSFIIGTGTTSHLGTIFSISPGAGQGTAINSTTGQTSHVNQAPDGWNIDVPMTTVAINSGSINTTGPVTVGGTGHSIARGTAGNTDLAGEFAFSGGATATYTWAGTYASHPEVTLIPQATTATSCAPFVTYTGVTSFTINFPSAFTGSVSYTVIGRN